MYHKIVSLKLRSVIFSQIYWQNISKMFIKNRLVSKSAFYCFCDQGEIFKSLIFMLIYKCIAYNRHYVKWVVNSFRTLISLGLAFAVYGIILRDSIVIELAYCCCEIK